MKIEILVTFLSLLVAPLAHLSGTRPSEAGLVVIVVPPWRDALAVAQMADARPIGPTEAVLGLQVAVDRMDQIDDLSQAGAWFILDAEKAKWICGT